VFEDYGAARLVAGRARVDLDPVFAQTIDTSSYRVFVSPASADTRGLAVVARDGQGFTVQELDGGAGGYDFDYRIVGTRKGVPSSHRLARFTPPSPPAPPAPGPPPAPPPVE
jgi:hypothetical protein